MSNWVYMRLDVLASTAQEINQIERALQEPCDELLPSRAERSGRDTEETTAGIKKIVAFKPVCNLGYVHPSVNKARRFENKQKKRYWALVRSHIDSVSANFPKVSFLAEYWDDESTSGGKIVICAGEEIRSSSDGDQHAQGREWVLPNIFAPFEAEYDLGLECGTLWDEWMEGMRRQLAVLTKWYSGKGDMKPEQTVADEDGRQNQEKTD